MSNPRKLLLWIILVCLVLAGTSLSLAALSDTKYLLPQIASTALLTAVSLAVLFKLTSLMNQHQNRYAAFYGIAVLALVFLMFLALIWASFRLPPHFNIVMIVPWLLLLYSPIPFFFLRLVHQKQHSWAGWIGAGLTILAQIPILLLPFAPAPHGVPTDEPLITSSLVFLWLGVVCGMLLADWHLQRPARWRWLGITAAAIAAFLSLIRILIYYDQNFLSSPAITLTGSLAVVLAYANLTSTARLLPSQRWLRWLAVVLVFLAVGLTDLLLLRSELPLVSPQSDFLERSTGAAAILAACTTLVLAVLTRLNRYPDLEPGSPPTQLVQIRLHCPRCGRLQTLPIGQAYCASCQLRIFTRIEEPRCIKCGYLLYQLQSDCCPECGTPLGQSLAPPSELPSQSALV